MVKFSKEKMQKQLQRLVGAHVSASGGVHKAIERAHSIGCSCVQVFSGSPRVWAKGDLSKLSREKIASECEKYEVKPIFTHALYLVNLASENPELIEKSLNSLTYELNFDALIGGAGVIVHLGSHKGLGFAAVREQLVALLDQLLAKTPTQSKLLIENAASRNGKIGGDLQEIQYLLTQLEKKGKWVSKKRAGWCFDTCHGFAGGYYLGAKPPNLEQVLTSEKNQFTQAPLISQNISSLPISTDPEKLHSSKFEHSSSIQTSLFSSVEKDKTPLSAYQTIKKLDLFDTLTCIHVNDSKDVLGSNRDRHANLGEGLIDLEDLHWFLTQEELLTIAVISEAPGFDNQGPDKENIERLKKLIG